MTTYATFIQFKHLRSLKGVFAICLAAALSAACWFVGMPAAEAVEITPAQMIQSKLPQTKTLVSASKSEVLAAVCAAIRKWQEESPQIVRTAAGARREFASDIVKEGLHCLSSHGNCDLIGQTVAAGISVNPEQASNIIDLAVEIAPNCRGAIETAGTPSEGPETATTSLTNLNPPPGSPGNSAVTGNTNSVTICDNGQNVQIARDQESSYLASHPGSRTGACQATPGVNK